MKSDFIIKKKVNLKDPQGKFLYGLAELEFKDGKKIMVMLNKNNEEIARFKTPEQLKFLIENLKNTSEVIRNGH